MRCTFALILALWAQVTCAQVWEDQRLFGDPQAPQKLQVLSSTDTLYLAPLITAFVAQHPDWSVEYFVAGTADIYNIANTQPHRFDVVISSAMDLQIKLVNDGHAERLNDLDYPEWAQWRQSLFGFTAEPASIILNKQAFTGLPIPETRQDLIALLRSQSDLFRSRVATYDIRDSGVGYLFATQDARTSETYWRLTEVMGSLGTKLYCCSGAMIDAVEAGEIYLAYNVLGSYAETRAHSARNIVVIVPTDFSTTMMRTIYLAKTSERKEVARAFVEFTLSYTPEGKDQPASLLPPLFSAKHTETRPLIPLEPSLMIYLDQLKRRDFIKEWESAIIQY
ncbi:ABC transporter substrate-binding protein [Epibacterium sp. SM1969]|uniref:ABC transporter substrate-binding protein n=1 Tax=Tritonibacter aquimaris TaxID=2663379 RepID=A0A844ANQ2_9RHOB|nr:ABC transporter substrate-binding protein [Tritonibacter aquimaris]MQY42043.1 ABC transporter substrate-binding protein [Tritonibacter aquimaris]